MTYNVTVRPSGQSFAVDDGEGILDAALRQGVGLAYGCRNGFCGACRVTLLAGEVAYPDGVPGGLKEEERAAGAIFCCKAHPVGDLTLEAELVEAEEIKPGRFTATVARMERLSSDVMALYLSQPENERLQFRAGQYIDVVMADGRKRAFSLANAPHHDEVLELHVRHVAGGEFTGHVFNDMKLGDELVFEGPLGSFHLRETSERPIICMGGGTGFAPLKGILEHAFAEGLKNPMHLYWGVHAEADLYLKALPEGWAAQHPGFNFTPVLSRPTEGGEWSGRTGWVHEAVVADHPDLSGFDIYMSGPPAMIDAAKGLFLAHGHPQERLFFDAFEFAKK